MLHEVKHIPQFLHQLLSLKFFMAALGPARIPFFIQNLQNLFNHKYRKYNQEHGNQVVLEPLVPDLPERVGISVKILGEPGIVQRLLILFFLNQRLAHGHIGIVEQIVHLQHLA